MPGGVHLVGPTNGRGVGRRVEPLRVCVRLCTDGLEHLHRAVQGLPGLGLGGFGHKRLLHDQREVHRGGMDDVEYGLRCGRPPIIIKGVQVWHETFEHRQTPIMLYYDTRNPLFVNEVYGLDEDRQAVLDKWKQKISLYHVNKDFISEYYVIKAMDDYLKGLPWLYKVDPARNHSKLQKTKIYKVKNSVLWRIVVHKYRRKYKM